MSSYYTAGRVSFEEDLWRKQMTGRSGQLKWKGKMANVFGLARRLVRGICLEYLPTNSFSSSSIVFVLY